MTAIRTASCSCGALRVGCRGEPARISVCHCTECQKRTGSPFAAQATYAADQVTIEGQATAFTRGSDDGNWVRTWFCPTCGSTVYYEIQVRPEMVSVALGGFADSAFPEPTVEVYGERRYPWVRIETHGEREQV
jgi:hypothetical protein